MDLFLRRLTRTGINMPEESWLEPLDRRIEQVKEETEAIKKETAALAALRRLYEKNGDGMKRLADL